ncbi:MAG: GNAT family N-acetyltransferase [Planctomycetota bacterium]|nr:GNAT family N-acetyltransferase [Planctomycetaceae bacterium]MDQ3329794.1 GNAT family N-acetyltransferase [Planctomycetota bacterium]
MPFHITPATPDDAPIVVDYNIALASETESKTLERATVEKGVRAVLGDSAKGRYFLARLSDGDEAGAVIGQLMVTFEWSDWRNGMMWWVQSVYVRQDWRRRGVFRALFQHVVDVAKSEGVPVVRLYVEEHNGPARETYAALGLEPTGYLVLERPL